MDVARSTNLSPTYAEIAERFRSKARNFLHRAEQYGDTPKGRAALAEASDYSIIAAQMDEKQAEALAARDGFLTEYRKARANA